MPRVKPFSAVHYNGKSLGDLSQVITPPYDNIPPQDVPLYRDASPYNFTHIILPRPGEPAPYQEATRLLGEWRDKEILIKDPKPGYYVYRQTFEWEGKTHRRDTLMALVHLSEFGDGHVRPHENTHGAHKEDRLRILRQTQHNLSHIFMMVRDKEGYLTQRMEAAVLNKPIVTGQTREGVDHGVWHMKPDKDLEAFLEKHPFYILDGHHRYSSAVLYAKELGVLGKTDHPAAYTLCTIANSYDPALLVLPTHRGLKPTGRPFDWEAVESSFHVRNVEESEIEKFCSEPQGEPIFYLYGQKRLMELRPKHWQNAAERLGHALANYPVVWSDNFLLRDIGGIEEQDRATQITYLKSWKELWERKDEFQVSIFHSPPEVDTIAKIADENGFMPQKSTFFYPKVAAGLVLRELKE